MDTASFEPAASSTLSRKASFVYLLVRFVSLFICSGSCLVLHHMATDDVRSFRSYQILGFSLQLMNEGVSPPPPALFFDVSHIYCFVFVDFPCSWPDYDRYPPPPPSTTCLFVC